MPSTRSSRSWRCRCRGVFYVTSSAPTDSPGDRALVGDELERRLESMVALHLATCRGRRAQEMSA